MQIFVRDRRTIVLIVEPTDTVLSVMEQIWDREGIHPKYLLLTHGGQVLLKDRTLASYGIEKEQTILYRIRHVTA